MAHLKTLNIASVKCAYNSSHDIFDYMTTLISSTAKITENALFSFLYIAALFSALFYTGNNVYLFSAAFTFISLMLSLVLKQRYPESQSIAFNGIFVSSVLLLSWFAIAIFPSQVKYLTLYNFFWVGSLVIIFLLFTFANNKNQIWQYVWPVTLFLVLIWALYGLIQYYYLHVPTNATFLNRNTLAALINLLLLPATGYFLIDKSINPWPWLSTKTASFILLVLFLTIFIISSRGATLSLLTGLFILLFFSRNFIIKKQLYILLAIILSAFLMASFSQYFISGSPEGIAERMMTLQNTSAAGNSRFIIWESLLPLFESMPWYGIGLGSLWLFWPPYRPFNDNSAGFFAHNDYMQITLEAGYPGIILLIALFVFILMYFIRAIKNYQPVNQPVPVQQVEIIALFSALTCFAAHSMFTYNFYVLPLLLIAGLYLARFNQLVTQNSASHKTIPALKIYFKPFTFILSAAGITLILLSYFFAVSFSNFYNAKAKELMQDNQLQQANSYFLKAQSLTPVMDNPFFSHADLLRRSAEKLKSINKSEQADTLLSIAHENLDRAEQLNPFRPQTHHIRGLIFEAKDTGKAMAEYSKALALEPRFLFSRIRLAMILHNQNQLKQAVEVLYEGVNYTYPVDKVMLEYMTLFAKYSREAGVESFAMQLEDNIKKFNTTLNQHL